jgi:hypothetical protein
MHALLHRLTEAAVGMPADRRAHGMGLRHRAGRGACR